MMASVAFVMIEYKAVISGQSDFMLVGRSFMHIIRGLASCRTADKTSFKGDLNLLADANAEC